MFGPIKNFIFDFDGTLVDSLPFTVKGLLKVLNTYSEKEITVDELYHSGFGKTPYEILCQWLQTEDKIETAFEDWKNWQSQISSESCPLFEGVLKTLQYLKDKGHPLAIVTGRDEKGTHKILSVHPELQSIFSQELMRFGDSEGLKAKPAPDGLLDIIQKNNWNAEETLMIGDHKVDIEAGQNAGCKTAAVCWALPTSFGPTLRARYKKVWENWQTVPCDVRLNKPEALIEWTQVSIEEKENA